MAEDRIERIETMLAHQDRQIQELSEVVHLQSKEIKALRLRQEKMMAMQAAASENNADSLTITEQAARDKPPHY